MKRDFIYIILSLLIVNISIILNIPLLRQGLPFIFFTFIPGFLLLKILKIKTQLSQLIVFSVALSVSFLYLIGLFVNMVFPAKPLGYSFLISSNLIVLFLTFILRNEELFNFQATFDMSEIKFYIMGIILPFLVILGSYLLNKFNSNLLILFSIAYLIAYIVIVLRFKIEGLSYPFIIWILSLSLLFMVSLRTDYLISGDTVVEYNLFKVSAASFKWILGPIPYALRESYNACISITLLPTLYYFMSNLNTFYIFKLFLIFIISFIPLSIYRLNSLFLSEEKSFMNTLLFISYYQFIYAISNLRTLIATLYFVLIVLLIFDEAIPKMKKSILLLIFAVSLVFSHYSTTYVTFIFILTSFIILNILKRYQKNQAYSPKGFTITFTIFIFVMLFLWYALINFYSSSFDNFVGFLKNTLISFMDAFRFDMYHEEGQRIFGIGLKWPAEYINMAVYYITMFTILIGFLGELLKRLKGISMFEDEFFVFMTLAMAILASTIVLPYISKGYGSARVLLFCLVVLSPCFILGADKISNILSSITRYRISFDVKYVSLLIIFSFLFTNIGVVYQVFGDHHSMIFNNDGFQYETAALHKEELYGALWLNETKGTLKLVSGDRYTHERLTGFGLHLETEVSSNNFSNDTYIFLRKGVLSTGKFYIRDFDYENLDQVFKYMDKTNKIYDNGGTVILEHI